MSYYNTNGLTGSNLNRAQRAANSQNELIYQFLLTEPGPKGQVPYKWTVSDILKAFWRKRRWPRNSVGRACTQLSKKGRAKKLTETKPGPYGPRNPEHFYAVAAYEEPPLFTN